MPLSQEELECEIQDNLDENLDKQMICLSKLINEIKNRLSVLELVNKTQMSYKDKIKTMNTIDLIKYKLDWGEVLDDSSNTNNSDQYDWNTIKNRIITILKGHSGNWSRQTYINYKSLGFIYVNDKDSEQIFGLKTWCKTNPSNSSKCLLVSNNLYPGLFTWNYQRSKFYDLIQIPYNKIYDHFHKVKQHYNIHYTIQYNEHLLKINTSCL